LLNEALAAHTESLRLDPSIAQVHNNLGSAQHDLGMREEAMASIREAIRLSPNIPEVHRGLGLALLLKGRFEEGWPEYEWRLRCADMTAKELDKPRWDESDLGGKTIFIYTEQGLGDTIQNSRFLSLVARRGGKVILQCRPELVRLLSSNPNMGQIVPTGAEVPPYDVHCPLLSLPGIFHVNLKSIPAQVPYLYTEPAAIIRWQSRLGPRDGKLRVGLTWAGNPQFKSDRFRSINFDMLAPLATVPGVRFFSLQKGPAGQQLKNLPSGMDLIDLGPELRDFADTAAVMQALDLIVTTVTSIPHLAGALARPVWVMLQKVPHFTWLLDREDSPWYPTMRLFRQKNMGDWQDVIERVAEALKKQEI
jgi:hypothetical protein